MKNLNFLCKRLLCFVFLIMCYNVAKPQGLGVDVAAPAGQLDVLGVAGRPSGLFNDNSVDADFRIEGDGDASLFMLDASTDRIGIGLAVPQAKLDINGTVTGDVVLSVQGAVGQTGDLFEIQNSGGSDLITVTGNALTLTGVIINEQSNDADVRIEGDSDAELFHLDASTDRIGIGLAAPQAKLDINGTVTGDVVLSVQGAVGQTGDLFEIQNSAGSDLITVTGSSLLLTGVIINEQGNDADVRIEGDTDAELFHLDASTDRIGIGLAAPQAKLDINGTATADVVLSVQGAVGQTGDLFEIQNSGGSDLITVTGSSLVLTGVIINEQGNDADLRIEGDNNANLFYLDAGNDRIGIGSATPARTLDVRGTIIGALPVMDVDCHRYDEDSDGDDIVCMMAVVVPSTRVVSVSVVNANNLIATQLDDNGNWDAFVSLGDPCNGCTDYLMELSISFPKGDDKDNDENQGLIIARFSSGKAYAIATDATTTTRTTSDQLANWDDDVPDWIELTITGGLGM